MPALKIVAFMLVLGQAPDPSSLCARDTSRLQPAADLYCIDLVPTAEFAGVSGAVELRRGAVPFGAAVTADGRPIWDAMSPATQDGESSLV